MTTEIDFDNPFTRAVLRAVPIGIVTALVAPTVAINFWPVSWRLSSSIFVAAACGGFLLALTFQVGLKHGSWLLASVGAIIAAALPAGSVILFCAVVRVPWQEPPFWTVLPAPLTTNVVIDELRRYALRCRKK